MCKDLRRYDTLFEDFLVNIALTQTQAIRIDETLSEAIAIFMSNYADLDVYTQGSYAMGTIVKPLTANQSKSGIGGEYDIDIVLEREEWNGPAKSLADTHNILVDEYTDKVDNKKRESCERVYHSRDLQTEVLFHADYVPVLSRLDGACRYVARRSQDRWADSDTKRLKEWFLEYVEERRFVQALIVILKRIRDYAELTDKFPSICIMAIVCSSYKQTSSYAEDLILVVKEIVKIFSKPYGQIVITMPTVNENLAKKIKPTDCDIIRVTFQECLAVLEGELICKDEPDLNKIRAHLSSDFPNVLSDYPECLEALRNRDLGIELDGSLKKKDISECDKKADTMKKTWYKFLGKGKPLKFMASTDYNKTDYGIRWQVLNAVGSKGRRGNLFKARGRDGIEGSSSNEFINHETESYDGTHWIKYFIYDKHTRKVVEIGKKFHVEVIL